MGKKGRGPAAEEAELQGLLRETMGYVLPKARAGRACDNLLSALKTFDGVFAAPEEVLRDIPEVGEDGAHFLRLVIRLCRGCLEERSSNLLRIFDTPSAVAMFRPKFLGRKEEVVCLMLLDGQGRAIYNDVICEGSVTQVPIHLRQVLRLCIEYHVSDIFLAHNHPSGTALPSPHDLIATEQLITGLDSIGAELKDHIIFAGDSYYSFQDSGLLGRQKDLARTSRAQELDAVRQMAARIQGTEGG